MCVGSLCVRVWSVVMYVYLYVHIMAGCIVVCMQEPLQCLQCHVSDVVTMHMRSILNCSERSQLVPISLGYN